MKPGRASEIRRKLKEARREMKELGVRRVSCFNPALSPAELHYNTVLFRLETELRKAQTSKGA